MNRKFGCKWENGLEVLKKYKYSLCVLILAFLFNEFVYYLARYINLNRMHYNLTLSFDNEIPVIPWTTILYFGCFLFWTINYFICSRQSRKNSDIFFCSDFLSKIICFFLFIILPSTNIRPLIQPGTIWNQILLFLYKIDMPDNLFPSIHCLVSWLCWIGLRNQKQIKTGYKIFSFLMAIAICICTLTTKQHVIVDVIAAVGLAEVSYLVSKKCYRYYSKFIHYFFHI